MAMGWRGGGEGAAANDTLKSPPPLAMRNRGLPPWSVDGRACRLLELVTLGLPSSAPRPTPAPTAGRHTTTKQEAQCQCSRTSKRRFFSPTPAPPTD